MHRHKTQARYPKGRVDALTDGIFAVAMTLLVLDIHLPEGFSPTGASQMVQGLLDLLPKFGPYVVSFMLLGLRWLSLAREFHTEPYVEGAYIKWWLVYLMLITCVPFSTIVIGRYASFAPAVWVYCANTALLAAASWRMAQLTPHVGDAKHLKHWQVSMAVLLLSSIVCAALSFINPLEAIWAFILNLASPLLVRWMEHLDSQPR